MHPSQDHATEDSSAGRPDRRTVVVPGFLLLVAMVLIVVTQWGTLTQLRSLVTCGAGQPDDVSAGRLVDMVWQWGGSDPVDRRLAELKAGFTSAQLVLLLVHREPEVRRCAVRATAAIGDRSCVDPLLGRLHDPDHAVRATAERAVETIWMRLGSEASNDLLATAVRSMADGKWWESLDALNRALVASPNFAEAYHQRAIVHFHDERFDLAAIDCERALQNMPRHYGALAALGRCLLELDYPVAALAAFHLAQGINPNLRLEGLIASIRLRLSRRPAAI